MSERPKEAYGPFAALYDSFMAGTDYRGWVAYAEALIAMHGAKPGLMLELGCGTGSATVIFKELGYDMIGLDLSAEMLAQAKLKDPEILYINQDMREFELYGTVDAAVSLCDSMNYILEPEELLGTFSLVANYLNPGGVFAFDMNTARKYAGIGGRAVLRRAGGNYLVWDNRWYPDDMINEYRLHMFVRRDGGLYERFEEIHLQRAYDPAVIKELITASGLEFLGVYGCKTFKEPTDKAGRVFFAARKSQYNP